MTNVGTLNVNGGSNSYSGTIHKLGWSDLRRCRFDTCVVNSILIGAGTLSGFGTVAANVTNDGTSTRAPRRSATISGQLHADIGRCSEHRAAETRLRTTTAQRLRSSRWTGLECRHVLLPACERRRLHVMTSAREFLRHRLRGEDG